ncbi:MAG: molybdate ABC transporter substrate-binding protein [Actinobacteria bacterium]|nr:molybdate ABC transporter substrate-binding protein [Actinomycetota bacterium]
MHHRPSCRSTLAVLLVGLLVLLAGSLVACGEETTDTTVASGTATGPTATVDPTVAAPTTTDAEPTTTTLGKPRELTVSAASSLKAAFTEAGAAFDKANNAKTTFNFDASGTLQKQIESGAPVDVFAAAAMKQVNALVEGKFIEQAAVGVFAGNEIVVAVPTDSALEVASFEDLAKADVKKVAYGDPAAAPHGVYAEEAMTTLGILDQVKPKVIYTKNASQTLTYVTSGEVDAGIMFSTDAVAGGEEVKVAVVSDPSWHGEIVYPAAVVAGSANQDLAQAFVAFLMGAEGQAILEKHGFVPPPASGATVDVKGLVAEPTTFTLADLQALKVTTITAEHPKNGATEYTGVLLSDLMAAVGVQSTAQVLNIAASDGFMGMVNLAELDANAMIAFGDDGKLDSVMPGQTGKAWVKDVVVLDFQ